MKRILFIFTFSLIVIGFLLFPTYSSGRIVKVSLSKNTPLVFTDDKGVAQGIYVDLIRYIAKEEGWTLQFVPCKWRECQQKLQNEDIDLLMSIAYTKERGEKFDFTEESVFNNWAYVYRKPLTEIETIVDLDGEKMAVVKGNIHSTKFISVLKSFGLKSEIIEVDDYHSVFRLIDNGEASAGIANRLNGLKYEKIV